MLAAPRTRRASSLAQRRPGFRTRLDHRTALLRGGLVGCGSAILSERQVLFRMHAVASRIDNRRRDEDDEAGFAALAGLAAEQPADKREVAKEGNLILEFGGLIQQQPAQN